MLLKFALQSDKSLPIVHDQYNQYNAWLLSDTASGCVYFIKDVNPSSTQPSLKFNGGLADLVK